MRTFFHIISRLIIAIIGLFGLILLIGGMIDNSTNLILSAIGIFLFIRVLQAEDTGHHVFKIFKNQK